MNILEALKSGKRYRRQIWGKHDPNFWLESLDQTDTNNKHLGPTISYSSILADDWEVEETVITITENTFRAAWIKACQNNGYHDDKVLTRPGWLYAELKKELGL